MNKETEVVMNDKPVLVNILNWTFGIVVAMIGLINVFWGNDPGYGIFIFLLSFFYFPSVTSFFKEHFGRSIPLIVKIILGIFILWTALGVAELFDKIDLMIKSF